MSSMRRTSPEALFVVGGISQYLGAATAVGLFDQVAPASVALLRVLGASLVAIARGRSHVAQRGDQELVELKTLSASIVVAANHRVLAEAR